MIGLILALITQSAEPSIGAEPKQEVVTQAMLDEMSARCRTPKRWLKHRGGDLVQFQPSRRAKYEQVDCVLQHLKDSLVPMNFGFVGNEATEDAGKQ
jgi:hypothetical protein